VSRAFTRASWARQAEERRAHGTRLADGSKPIMTNDLGGESSMRISALAAWLSFAIVAALLAAPAQAGEDRFRLRAQMENTGVDPDASGKIWVKLRPTRSDLGAVLKGLDPATSYSLTVGGVPEASFQPNAAGVYKARFRTSAPAPELLDFDPRGLVVAVNDGSADVLRSVISGPGEAPGTVVDERSNLVPQAVSGEARVEARFQLRRDERRKLTVKVEGVPDGSYDLFVDGTLRATIPAARGRGKVAFDTKPGLGKLPLDFDPRGLVIDLVAGSSVVSSGPLEAQIDDVNVCAPEESEIFLAAAVLGGQAKARFRTKDDCDRDFRVEVEDVPEGLYELWVAGVPRGAFDVVFDPAQGENEGEIEFDTDPDDPHEQLLDFDPVGQLIEVRQAGTVFFSSTFDPGDPGPQTCALEEIAELLNPTAVEPLASGEARVRRRDDCNEDFRVQIEDVAEATYDLVVGGVLRGSFAAAFDPSRGQVRGEIEFDTDPDDPGELPLSFDPRGQDVEVFRAGTLVLSTTVTGGGSDPGPVACTESELELPLLNTGLVPSASGHARHRVRDDCRESLRVQIEDVADGVYDLSVGGVVRGSITVAFGQGEIEFDTDDAPKPLLDFPVRGESIQVNGSGGAILERDFPL
jgi:hypothetical protein